MKRILPAYPLFVKDPYFSLWSVSERLNASDTQSWWGTEKRLYGFIRTGGETYCFLGRAEAFAPCGVKAAEQLSLSVTAYTTDYRFRAGETILNVRFVSPLPPSDPELLSLPVCYMEYSAEGADAEISLFVNRRIAYNDIAENTNREVRGGAFPLRGFECAFLGLKRQLPFSNNDDLIGADWGYYYLSGERAYFLDERSLSAYLSGGRGGFSCEGEERYLGSVNFSREGAVMLGYDDLVSVDYFGEWLKGGYLARNTIVEALEYIHAHRKETDEKLDAEDAELRRRTAAYGEDYYDILVASLRQSVAAHKLVRDREGNVLFLSKECGSNGCIGTVDLSYPSMPLYLLANTELLKGMMRPILKFAKMPVWPYDFAPHDVGTYPACCGQVYGLSVSPSRFHGDYVKTWYPETHFPVRLLPPEFEAYDPDMQMPVEESANMLVMFLACYRADGDIRFFKSERGLAEKWAKYLAEHGLKPENQLCTDDFAGHLKNNVNLAIKATVGVAALCGAGRGGGRRGRRKEVQGHRRAVRRGNYGLRGEIRASSPHLGLGRGNFQPQIQPGFRQAARPRIVSAVPARTGGRLLSRQMQRVRDASRQSEGVHQERLAAVDGGAHRRYGQKKEADRGGGRLFAEESRPRPFQRLVRVGIGRISPFPRAQRAGRLLRPAARRRGAAKKAGFRGRMRGGSAKGFAPGRVETNERGGTDGRIFRNPANFSDGGRRRKDGIS